MIIKFKQDGGEKPEFYPPTPNLRDVSNRGFCFPRQPAVTHGGSSFCWVIFGLRYHCPCLQPLQPSRGWLLAIHLWVASPSPISFLGFPILAAVGRQPFIEGQGAAIVGESPEKLTLRGRFGCRISMREQDWQREMLKCIRSPCPPSHESRVAHQSCPRLRPGAGFCAPPPPCIVELGWGCPQEGTDVR